MGSSFAKDRDQSFLEKNLTLLESKSDDIYGEISLMKNTITNEIFAVK